MIKDYLTLAFGNIKHRGIRSWLTMLGVFIGIAAVVSLISLGQGLQTAITSQFSTLSTDRLTIQNAGTGFGPPGSTSVRKLTDHDVNIIEQTNGVKIAVSRLIRMAYVDYNNVRDYHYIASMPTDNKKLDFVYSTANLKVESGRLLRPGDKDKVILGSDFITTKAYGKDLRVGSSIMIQGRKFQIVGFTQKTSTFVVNTAIMMMEDDMKSLLNIDSKETDLIVAQVDDKDKIIQVADDIKRKLRKDRGEKVGEEDFSVETPISALKNVNLILNIINIIVSGIAAISLIVGGIGIMNSMFTSVLERTKEIGVMKAVGAQNKNVLLIFLFESGLLGLVGGVVGALMGLAMAFSVSGIANQAFGSNILDVTISYPLLFASISFALLIGLASGILPALQASKLKPVEAFRR